MGDWRLGLQWSWQASVLLSLGPESPAGVFNLWAVQCDVIYNQTLKHCAKPNQTIRKPRSQFCVGVIHSSPGLYTAPELQGRHTCREPSRKHSSLGSPGCGAGVRGGHQEMKACSFSASSWLVAELQVPICLSELSLQPLQTAVINPTGGRL